MALSEGRENEFTAELKSKRGTATYKLLYAKNLSEEEIEEYNANLSSLCPPTGCKFCSYAAQQMVRRHKNKIFVWGSRPHKGNQIIPFLFADFHHIFHPIDEAVVKIKKKILLGIIFCRQYNISPNQPIRTHRTIPVRPCCVCYCVVNGRIRRRVNRPFSASKEHRPPLRWAMVWMLRQPYPWPSCAETGRPSRMVMWPL